MQVTIGIDPERPKLEAHLSHRDVSLLMDRPGFAELREGFITHVGLRDVSLIETAEYETYALHANRIGSGPPATHERRLWPFVRLLEWGTIVDEQKPAMAVKLIEIESQKSFDGHYHVETIVRWPKASDKQIVETTTTAMQLFGRQLRYGSYTRPQDYDREVGVGIARSAQRQSDHATDRVNVTNVDIHTLPSNFLRAGHAFTNKGSYFEVGGNCLKTHKEQLVHLVGAIAIGYTDQLASS